MAQVPDDFETRLIYLRFSRKKRFYDGYIERYEDIPYPVGIGVTALAKPTPPQTQPHP